MVQVLSKAKIKSVRFFEVQQSTSITGRVRWSVCRSIGWSHFIFFYDFISLTSLLLCLNGLVT